MIISIQFWKIANKNRKTFFWLESIWLFDNSCLSRMNLNLNAVFFFHFPDEQDMYQDILQEDFVDSYNNLTLKSVMTLKYYANLRKEKLLLLKTDDDSYVHIGEFDQITLKKGYAFDSFKLILVLRAFRTPKRPNLLFVQKFLVFV